MTDDKVVGLHGRVVSPPDKTSDMVREKLTRTVADLDVQKMVAVGVVLIDSDGCAYPSFVIEDGWKTAALVGGLDYLKYKVLEEMVTTMKTAPEAV